MSETRLFTSESVADGHPDKVADQISDAILDEFLTVDPEARVAIETAVKGKEVWVFGEATANTDRFDHDTISEIVDITLGEIGYEDPVWLFNPSELTIRTNITKQSHEIAGGVDSHENIGAGDQGIMFGYASNETECMMPMPIHLAHELMRHHKHMRHQEEYEHIGPDAKAQVTMRYDVRTGKPLEVDTVVWSSVHDTIIDPRVVKTILEEDARMVLEEQGAVVTENTKFLVNPAGPWMIGGPVADSGLTGRKIIVDTYGGAAPHGGGAFSGKDPTKVDRSAAYAARHVAKLILTSRPDYQDALVQLSYAIGRPDPVSVDIWVNTKTTPVWFNHEELKTLPGFDYDLTPRGIIEKFDLRRPIYADTAAFGHFGREQFPWERV